MRARVSLAILIWALFQLQHAYCTKCKSDGGPSLDNAESESCNGSTTAFQHPFVGTGSLENTLNGIPSDEQLNELLLSEKDVDVISTRRNYINDIPIANHFMTIKRMSCSLCADQRAIGQANSHENRFLLKVWGG